MKRIAGVLLLSFSCRIAAIAFAAPPSIAAASQPHPAPHSSAWSFAEDFGHGIPGWMSFPLAQDIGYDPSIYTTAIGGKYVLVRDVTAEGQQQLRVGMLRPVRFRIMPDSVIHLKYSLKMSGKPGPAKLLVGAASGTRFAASLPAGNGEHAVDLRGSQLHIPPSGADALILVIEADTADAISGSHNRLVLEALTVHAERAAAVPVMLPHLAWPATMGVPVATSVVTADHPILTIRTGLKSATTELTLYDGSGRLVNTQALGNGRIDLGSSPEPGLWRAHLANGGAGADFRFLVLGRIPPHPRLLLTPERLEQLRSQMPSDALRRIVRDKAASSAAAISYNAKAGEAIRLMSPESVFPGLKDYASLLGAYGDTIMLNALDYRLRGSEQSLDAARKALLAASRWPTWTPAWFSAHGLHTYYQAGIFLQENAFGYDLIADRLSAGEKAQIADGFYRNGILPAVEEYFLNDRMPIAASNHMAHSVGGAIGACIAVYGDVPDWNERFGPALADLLVSNEKLLQGLFPGDGSEAEPVGYGAFAMQGLAFGMTSLQRVGIRPPGTKRMIESFWWPYYAQYRPGRMLDTGDWSGDSLALSGYAWGAEYSGDPTLRAFYDSAVTRSLKDIFVAGRSDQAPPAVPGMLDLICCTRTAGRVPPAPPSRLFPLRGSAVLRSGWGLDSTVISLRAGAWFNHEHHDQGSFQIAANGEELIAEGGYTEYYDDPRYQDFFTQAPAHNTIMLDNDAFSQNSYQGRYWKGLDHYPAITRHLLGSDMDFLSADLTPAYDGSLKSFTREFLFLKPDVLLIHDRVCGAAPHRYSFLLHIPAGDAPGVDGMTATVQGKKASAFVVAAGTAARWAVEAEPIPVTAYRDFDRVPVEPRNAFRLQSGQTEDAVFTVGVQILPSATAVRTLKTISNANAEGFSAGAGRQAIAALFRTRPGELSRDGITTDGEVLAIVGGAGNPRHLFAGKARSLREGGNTRLSSNVPVDAEITTGGNEDTVQLFAALSAAVNLEVRSRVRSLSIDGKETTAAQEGHLIQLKLSPGEHSVHISY